MVLCLLIRIFWLCSTKSLVSISCIEKYDYLSKLEKITFVKLDFQVANGQVIRPKYAIKLFKVKIQNYTIKITYLAIDSLSTIDLILGITHLSELDNSLDSSNNTLYLKSWSNLWKTNKKITLNRWDQNYRMGRTITFSS